VLEIWGRGWKGKSRFNLLNFIIIWTMPPLIGEMVGRAVGFEFIGLAFGFVYSFAKTQYDYIKAKYSP